MPDWDKPAESDFFKIADHLGDLVIIAVNGYEPNFPTSMGPGPAIRAEIAVVEGNKAGARYKDALLFNKKLVPQLRSSLGSVVLARIAQGVARPGQSAPYQLADFSPEDARKANEWVKANGDVVAHVEADPRSATGNAYAPDDASWAAARENSARPADPYPGRMPEPPARPQTYASVPDQGDEPPF